MVEQADSPSSIKLKSEFQNYESIRREYDSRIIEMAMSNGVTGYPSHFICVRYISFLSISFLSISFLFFSFF